MSNHSLDPRKDLEPFLIGVGLLLGVLIAATVSHLIVP